MNFNRYLKLIVLFSISFFLFTACSSQVNKEGIVVSLSQNQLSESFKHSFPQKKDFVFGTIVIEEPIITIPKNSKRITASINLDFKTMFTQEIIGDFTISGEPLFDKKTTSIYLKDVKIENLQFTRLNLGEAFSNTFLNSLSPMLNNVLEQYPIYTIPKNSFQGRFVKNVKIENSKLLITYGI